MDLNAFVGQDPPDFLRGVGVLSAHQLRPGLDDGHFGAEAAIGLRQFEAGIAAADHDQMRRQDVELERFDMGQRLRGLEAWNIGNGGVRSHIDEDLVAVSVRVPPSFRLTSSVFGATKRPLPMINSAPLSL